MVKKMMIVMIFYGGEIYSSCCRLWSRRKTLEERRFQLDCLIRTRVEKSQIESSTLLICDGFENNKVFDIFLSFYHL